MDLIIVGVLVVAIVLIVALVRRRSRRLREQAAEQAAEQATRDQQVAELRTWVERVEAASSEEELAELPLATSEMHHTHLSDQVLATRFEAANTRRQGAYWREGARKTLAERLRNVTAATSVEKRRAALFHLVRFTKGGDWQLVQEEYPDDQADQWRQQLIEVAQSWLDQVAEVSRRDGAVFREKLFLFVRPLCGMNYEESPDGYAALGARLQLPRDFNEMVALYFTSPGVGDFVGQASDPIAGEVCLRAAAALHARSLVEAKIVLAYCTWFDKVHGVYHYKEAIGDVLLADLIKMVEQLMRERAEMATAQE